MGIHKNLPVYLKQVATIQDGPSTPTSYVSFGYGQTNENYTNYTSEYAAVTVSIAKVKGADAMKIAEKILNKVELLKQNLVPNDVHIEISRNLLLGIFIFDSLLANSFAPGLVRPMALIKEKGEY